MPVQLRFNLDGAEEFSLVLDRFQVNYQSAEPAFQAMANLQRSIWQKQFDAEGAYTGARWAALSPPYRRWKAKHYPGRKILERTGLLRESLTQRPFGIDEVKDDLMVIGTGVPYASYHQKGAPNLPARQMIQKPTPQDRRQFAKYLQNWIVTGTVE